MDAPHLNPTAHIADLGHKLSRVLRWGGQTIVNYSVLQHSLACGRFAALADRAPIEQLACYLHDAEEGVIGADLSRQHKTEEQRAYEETLRKEIYAELRLPYPDDDMITFVHEIDNIIALAEAEVLLHPVRRRFVHEEHEGETPGADDLDAAVEIVYALATADSVLTTKVDFITEVETLFNQRGVKALRGRL